MTFEALTWDHPRGYMALEAAARDWAALDGIDIAWQRQPLEGFESHPIEDLCQRFDIIVLDHPHLGEAVKAGALRPLDDYLDRLALDDLKTNTVGACLDSYTLDGQLWALPLDAASQVMAVRADLLDGAVPTLWSEVLDRSRRSGKVPLSLAGPHALLTLTSMAVSFGDRPGTGDIYLATEPGEAAIELFYDLAALSDSSIRALNPIRMLERMSARDDIAFCPLIFGYVTYSGTDRQVPVSFRNAPKANADGRIGSVLGGTGIAITKRCQMTPPLIEHLRRLVGADAQKKFIPQHAGQPSRRDAWQDAAVNACWGQFYANTLPTIEDAYVRPRHDGYMKFQKVAADLVRDAASSRPKARELIDQLNELYRQHRSS